MRVTSIDAELLTEIRYLNAGRRAGEIEHELLPVHRAVVDALPKGTAAIVVTADLQGRETFKSASGGAPRLMGEVLPALLKSEILPYMELPEGDIGVLLAGDFYTVPGLEKRGGTGDVRAVWDAFAKEFDWVVGVAGNHDTFGESMKRPNFSPPVHFLDKDIVSIGGVSIGGVSGIIGNPRRPWRRTEEEYLESLAEVLCERPAITILHDGPDAPCRGCDGSQCIREIIEQFEDTLVVRGHSHWPKPLAVLTCGIQVLNVDARVVILVRRPSNLGSPSEI